MKPETQQQKLLTTLHEAAGQRKSETFCYKSEWLGDLPFGQYHWLEMAGADLVADSPDSLREDLALLEQAGAIIEVQRREIDADTLHISYAFRGEKPDRTLSQGDQNNQQQQAEGNQKSKLSWLAYLVGALLLSSVLVYGSTTLIAPPLGFPDGYITPYHAAAQTLQRMSGAVFALLGLVFIYIGKHFRIRRLLIAIALLILLCGVTTTLDLYLFNHLDHGQGG